MKVSDYKAKHDDEKKKTKNVLTNLPNIITYSRIIAVPALAACFFIFSGDLAHWSAFAVFVFAGFSDFFDGYLARLWQQQSPLGRMLDPIADKLLIAVCLMVLIYNGTINGWTLWAAMIIMCREILVSGLREFLAELRVNVPVSYLAKWKTTVQILAIGFLLTGPAGDKVFAFNTHVGITGLWVAALLTIYTGYDYFRAGINQIIKEN